MANETEDFVIASPKRIKLELDDNECSSNADSLLSSSECIKRPEENGLRGWRPIISSLYLPDVNLYFKLTSVLGGETSTSGGSDEDEKKDVSEDSKNFDSDDEDSHDSSASTVSNVSDLSIEWPTDSDTSGQQWRPITCFGSFNWLEKQMLKGVSPRIVMNQITGENTELPDSISDLALWNVIFHYLSEPPRRNRLSNVHNVDHVVKLIQESSKIMVLTGAGVSVSCGIPDFRSRDGVYARLAVDFPNLPDPQAMFDINFFLQDPRPFFKFAKEIYPGQFRPSPSHRFIKAIERHKKLLRNYTQNIDTLERAAGIEKLIECHGSFATATCTVCNYKVNSDEIKETIFQQSIPYCTKCARNNETGALKGIMKPDIVFFGEGLPDTFHIAMANDKDQCDLLIVIGSSLKVRPVALIPNSLPSKVPQVLINRERLPNMNFDVELLGDSDVIIDHLCRKLGGDWTEGCWRESSLSDKSQPELRSYSSDTGSSDEECDNKDAGGSENSGESAKVKCQKIGKRHIGGSDETSRHMSLDSSRDSGIGENSNNSTDGSPSPSAKPFLRTPTHKPNLHIPEDKDNCFFCLQKRRYVFPGAEIPELLSSEENQGD